MWRYQLKFWAFVVLFLGLTTGDQTFQTQDTDRKDVTNATTELPELKHNDDFNAQRSPGQEDVDAAADAGLRMMNELHFVKEPQLYKMGLFLNPAEAAGRMATFSSPAPRALHQAKYGYATVQAALLLREKYPEKRGRSNPEHASFLRTAVLTDQCPLAGVPRCPPAAKRYRTADGTCNNAEHPWKGASMLPMQRFLLPSYEDGVQSVRRAASGARLPSPREISIRIHRDRDVEMGAVTMMFMQWGQFLDHDVTSTAQARAFNASIPRCCARGGQGFLPTEFTHPDCLPIAVPEDDWFLGRFGIRCLEFVRSAPSSRIDCDLGWREQINQVTSFIDASTVYGSDAERADSLRMFRNGQLQYGRRRRSSPPDPPEGEICQMGALSSDCFKGGDGRMGEQPGLTAFHTIWLRYHNRAAAILSNLNAHWSDEKIYQETRRIVAALIQHITYKEFLPIVLGHQVMDLFDLNLERKGFYSGYDARVNPAPANAFSAAAFRFGHSLVQNSYVRCDGHHRPMFNNVTIHEEQNNPENIWSVGSLDRLILGFANQASQRRDEFISKELTNHLFQTSDQPFGMDLAAVNIQRGRDHGIPSYTAWREPCGLSPIVSWKDLEAVMSFETVQRFRSLYEDVNDIDLYPGGLAEKPVRGGIVGPTFACIIAQQFANLRKGDRFWYENGDLESSFTPAQLQQIRKSTFAQILCLVLPEIETIQPFIFLSPDEFRNTRLHCNSFEMESIDMRAWEERKIKKPTFTDVNSKIEQFFNNEPQQQHTVHSKIEEFFNNNQHTVHNKLDFGNMGNIFSSKIEEQTFKPNNKLDFNIKPTSFDITNSASTKRPETSTPNDDFEVLFFTSNKGVRKNLSNKDISMSNIFDRPKRSPPVEYEYYEYDEYETDLLTHGRKKNDKQRRKKKPSKNRQRTTTVRTTTRRNTLFYQNEPLNTDFYNPLKIKVTNITTSSIDISDNKFGYRPARQTTFRPVTSTTRRPNYYNDGDYVLHPTITKQTGMIPDYQVNINIQLGSSTPNTEVKWGQPNVHIYENSYAQAETTNRPVHILPIRTTNRPDLYRPNSQNGPHFVTGKPSYDYNKFENRPFSTSKRPYIYKPSESYLAMFDELYTTKRPTYVYSYVDRVTNRPHIPSYLYLNDKNYKQDDEQYRHSTTERSAELYEYPDQGEKNFIKISSVQGNRYLTHGHREEIIHTAQQREGELELDDETTSIDRRDESEKILVDVIPRENRKDDWLLFNELVEEGAALNVPLFRSAISDNATLELPKPIETFWRTIGDNNEDRTIR